MGSWDINFSRKNCSNFSTITHLTFFRDGDVAIQPWKTVQEAGENVKTRDASIENGLRWLGKVFLEGVDTVIWNISMFNSRNEDMLQWVFFQKFLVRYDDLQMRFVGTDK